MRLTREDRDWMVEQALAAGFSLAGVAAVPGEKAAAAEERFAGWVAAGHAGEMEYLKRVSEDGSLVRADVRRSLPWARSVLVCAVDYSAPGESTSLEGAEPGRGWIARYAWSGQSDGSPADYHDVLLVQLQQVEAQLRQRFGEDLQSRCYVDTGPLLERNYAARAGLGWVGRNTCLLNQQQGSWLLLAVVVTSLEPAPEAWAVPAADRCGSCSRCIDACPTDALLPSPGPGDARLMDASRCIAYLTIEKKGSIAEELRPLMGRQVFGCDICQEVCPWNERAACRNDGREASPLLPPRQELINPELAWLASLDGPGFRRWFRGSPLERTRRGRVLRNVALAMGNSGETSFVPQLEVWAAGEDEVLAEAAGWALGRLRAAPQASQGST